MHETSPAQRTGIALSLFAIASLLPAALCAAPHDNGPLRLVSWGAPEILGQQGNRAAQAGPGAVSADGRFTVFVSSSNNLVANDPGRIQDVFVQDRDTGLLERVSRRPDGDEANNSSERPAISADGRWVAFKSRATDLTATAPNWHATYLHDRQSGETRAVATTAMVPFVCCGRPAVDDGKTTESPQEAIPPEVDMSRPAISADGGVVVFATYVGLLASDTDGLYDIYAYHRLDDTLELVNRDAAGHSVGVAHGRVLAVSGDGRHVAFLAQADPTLPHSSSGLKVRDLLTGAIDVIPTASEVSLSATGRWAAMATSAALLAADTNGVADIYLFDRDTRNAELISIGSAGALSDGDSYSPAVSADGLRVAFASQSQTFLPGGGNGGTQVYLRQRENSTTTLVSRAFSAAAPANTVGTGVGDVSISADGTAVVFSSQATDLVAADSNSCEDVFTVDAGTLATRRVSIATGAPVVAGARATGISFPEARAVVDAAGRHVLLNIDSDNLVPQGAAPLLRHDLVSGITAVVDFALPANATPHRQVVEAVSDDGASVLVRRQLLPVAGPWPDAPFDLWLDSPTHGLQRIDTSPLLPAEHQVISAAMSGDGQRIVFSAASLRDTPSSSTGIYLYEVAEQRTTRMDRLNDNAPGQASMLAVGISHNGRYMAFTSNSAGLPNEPPQGDHDLFVRDIDAGTITRLFDPIVGFSLVRYGRDRIGVSDDGNVLVFTSGVTHTFSTMQSSPGVLRFDRRTGDFRHLDARPGYFHANADSPSINADASRIAFRSSYDVAGEGNGMSDIFIYDMNVGSPVLASTDASGTAGNAWSERPYLTPDGRTLVFTSYASNWNSSPRVVGDVDVFVKELSEPPFFGDGFE